MLWGLVDVPLKQVKKHSHIHHKLDAADGGDAVVDIKEAADGRSNGAEKRLYGSTQPQHGACKSATRCHDGVVVNLHTNKVLFRFLLIITD